MYSLNKETSVERIGYLIYSYPVNLFASLPVKLVVSE
jgi:hypothetical protein